MLTTHAMENGGNSGVVFVRRARRHPPLASSLHLGATCTTQHAVAQRHGPGTFLPRQVTFCSPAQGCHDLTCMELPDERNPIGSDGPPSFPHRQVAFTVFSTGYTH